MSISNVCVSEVRPVFTFIEASQKTRFSFVFDIFECTEALVTLDHASSLRSNLVKNIGTPDITLLNVVKSFVTSASKHVNLAFITDLSVLTPVISQVQLSKFRIGIFLEALPCNNKRHVATVFAEKTKRLEMGLR